MPMPKSASVPPMHGRYPSPRQREPSVVCLTAVADVVDRLPALYRVVEHSEDDVRIDLYMKASAWEVLRFIPAGGDNVACFLSSHLESPGLAPFPAWLIQAIERLEADLHWAAYHPCADQGNEMLAALVTFRGSMLQGAVF
jgi:hypothetical protein